MSYRLDSGVGSLRENKIYVAFGAAGGDGKIRMRAEERHRLKTNELAQKLAELPEYLRKHSKLITIGVAVLVLVGVVGGFWWSSRKKAYSRRNEELQGLLPQINQIQIMAANAAQDPGTDTKSAEASAYNTSGLLGALQNLSLEAQGTSVGMAALMQQADLKRSQLYYTNRLLSEEEREKICRDAENLYRKILNQYGTRPMAAGMAKLGLALVAEDRGDWEKAKKTYEEILAEKDGKLTGTAFPFLAKRRLRMINEDRNNDGIADITVSIDFPYIEPAPEPEPQKPEITAADEEKVDPLKRIEPIKIELPKAPVPQVKMDEKPAQPAGKESNEDKTSKNKVEPEPKSSETMTGEKDEKKGN